MMEEHREQIERLYRDYRDKMNHSRSLEEVLQNGCSLYREMNRLNMEYNLWQESKGYDHEAIYYIAKFARENNPDICCRAQKREAMDDKEMAALLFAYMDERDKHKIHILEPHPDDMLGSASGLCYNEQVLVTVHTLTRSYDERDQVELGSRRWKGYQTVRKPLNIKDHHKYMLPDLHWDMRLGKEGMSFSELVQAYRSEYEAMGALKKAVKGIVEAAAEEGSFLAIPMGIEHPMHILVMDVCLECIEERSFNKKKLLIYVDHPYDFFHVTTERIPSVREYIGRRTGRRFLRCDDLGAGQQYLEPIIREIYGEKHFGEFAGALNRTLCSYLVEERAYHELREFIPLRCNHILYVTAQAKPFMKTGGLGEVALQYSRGLRSYVNDIRILMPRYAVPSEGKQFGTLLDTLTFTYESGSGDLECRIEKREYQGLIYYLLGMENQMGEDIFSFRINQQGYVFAMFCDAIMGKGLNAIDYLPNVLHCNDWQTALIPFLKKTKYRYYRPDLKVIYTIHFYGYKGIFPKKSMLAWLGMEKTSCRLCITCQGDCALDRIDLLSEEDRGKLIQIPPSLMSCMKAGIEFADIVSTVSKGYADELQTYPDCANVKVAGIRNGIDDSRYVFPQGSGFLDVISGDFCERKRGNKERLQRALGLEADLSRPIICMVTRLAIEKGIELVKNIIPDVLALQAQIVIVGDDADRRTQPYANYFRQAEQEFQGGFAYRAFHEELEYETYAGADILLMPSLSEACGTTQMNAMSYGVVPIVSMLDSFRDTVLDYRYKEERRLRHWEKGVGFYAYKDDCWVFLEVIKKAIEIYRSEPEEWKWIATTCMNTDFGWKNGSLYDYVKLYESLEE